MKPLMYVRRMAGAVVVLLLSAPLPAAEQMSAEAVRELLTKNTMNGKNIKKNRNFTSYFKKDGTVTKRNHRGKLQTGYWFINDNGEHCIDWGNGDRCGVIIDLGDNTYHIMGGNKPSVVFSITKGNSKRL